MRLNYNNMLFAWILHCQTAGATDPTTFGWHEGNRLGDFRECGRNDLDVAGQGDWHRKRCQEWYGQIVVDFTRECDTMLLNERIARC